MADHGLRLQLSGISILLLGIGLGNNEILLWFGIIVSLYGLYRSADEQGKKSKGKYVPNMDKLAERSAESIKEARRGLEDTEVKEEIE
ncbi:hypothetical protein ERYAMS2_00379 [Erysipelothrix amsterdamensis]|uniref:Uncharacterized protein n=1 Tax=Erysipelothrix amsterdamensis TaxID=2929157 RepID=A0AAU9VDJ9_9FIRM|nr:hypothetical protein [Erysipelothrix rhusiopathiae]CAH2760809.1 hypothetical protein ERYAMS2_00379 [Erysipelothrix sp. A18Y020d]AYV35318.1 hypothetical protein EEY85_08435 [Erysipelothrix rhusiopathiae]MDE8082250.1 hypothetical protein [Erysipelothrix rhusiopathiae]MDE8330083.1 hypothetical protein [Erysipelothrix rhusiopathiae]MDE8333190.1 hypothetical protein [Erysipelothrix rhusiopathiae]